MPLSERRGADRVELKAKIRAYVLSADGKVSTRPACTGATQDVSLGGLRLLARKPLPVNSLVELHIDCKRPVESCQLRGQVGWVGQESDHGYLIGLFVRETSHDRLVAWRRILERRGFTV